MQPVKKFGFEAYEKEIEEYVLNNQELVSGPLKMIVAEFNFWVDKYGHQTY